MTPAIVVARQVVREAARRRLLLALILLTIVVIALTVWGVSRIDDLRNAGQPLPDPQKKTIVSQLLILVMFMFSWVLSLAAVFIAAPAISGAAETSIARALPPSPNRTSPKSSAPELTTRRAAAPKQNRDTPQ